MLTFTTGDILGARAEALVNTVNCVGAMGRGIALQFRKAYPANYREYAAQCKRGEVNIGHVIVYETGRLTDPQYIINFPTKKHWRGRSRLEWIRAGLDDLVREVNQRHITSMAIPPLGCGLGGLNWRDVKPLIQAAAASMPKTHVTVYEPAGAPAADHQPRQGDRPPMTIGRAALVTLMDRYLQGGLDPDISLLEVHKLMYFMQAAGEELRLQYVKAPRGPYAENLRHVLNRVEGHFITGYAEGGDQPSKTLKPRKRAVEEAHAAVNENPGTSERLGRVSRLVTGFESPRGLELLASLHWLAVETGDTRPDQLRTALNQWANKGHHYSNHQFKAAYDHLATHGWFEVVGRAAQGDPSSPANHIQ